MRGVTIEPDRVRLGPRCAVSFQRTLRIPDDGRVYPLPPALGTFRVHRVADYAARVPAEWCERGGAFIAMYQREALWLGFEGEAGAPSAVTVAVGGINAVSGERSRAALRADPQDYLIVPDQPWLDGLNTGAGSIRQFVAMPLGLGYTVEGQIAGAEEFGGVQIAAYEAKPGRVPSAPPRSRGGRPRPMGAPVAEPSVAMGLGAGGQIAQKIYPDPHGLDTWDVESRLEVVVHIANSAQYREITGLAPPSTPVSARSYTELGLPWFELYDEERGDVAPSEGLRRVRSIAGEDDARGVAPDEEAEAPAEPGDAQRRPIRPSSGPSSGPSKGGKGGERKNKNR
ncbi:MAG: hypothetical protein WKG32_05170 [Gemmatimonadaceae bacterium]